MSSTVRSSSHRVSSSCGLVVETAKLFGLLKHLGLQLWVTHEEKGQVGLAFFKKRKLLLLLPLLGRYVPTCYLQSVRGQLHHLGLMMETAFDVWLFRHQKEKQLTTTLRQELRYGLSGRKNPEKSFHKLVKDGVLPKPTGNLFPN